jgi:hypothetical protein
MRRVKRALVVVLATVGLLWVPGQAADADAGCWLWRDLWYNTEERDERVRIIRVNAVNEYVCADPNRGHENNVYIDLYNPYTGVRSRVRSGRGFVSYSCDGNDFRWFYGPGPTLKINCS